MVKLDPYPIRNPNRHLIEEIRNRRDDPGNFVRCSVCQIEMSIEAWDEHRRENDPRLARAR